MSEIHRLLNRHFDVLTSLGSGVAAHLGDAPSEAAVRAAMVEAGYNVRNDVLDLFTWRSHMTWDGTDPATDFFAHTPTLISIEDAISMYDERAALRDEMISVEIGHVREEDEQIHPGPRHLLPFAVLDMAGWVSVDTRPDEVGGGSLVWSGGMEEGSTIFGSLSEAITIATWCLETRVWTVQQDSSILHY